MVSQPDDRILAQPAPYTGLPPVEDQTAKRGRTVGGVLIVAGIIVLIIGLVFAIQPIMWKSAKDIANDWKGDDYGYYTSFDEGSKVTVLGKITFSCPLDLIIYDTTNYSLAERNYYSDLKSNGYHYLYYLDYIYDLEFYSKSDLGNAEDEVALEFTLSFMTLDGWDYWVWTAKSIERPNANLYYFIGIPIVIGGLVLMGFGAAKYSAAKRGWQ